MTETDIAIPQDPHGIEAGDIRESASGLVLQQVAQPGVGAAVWRRRRSPAFAEWVETIPAGQLPALRALVDVRVVERCIHAACDLSGLPGGTMRDLLASDVAALALVFAQIMGNPLLHIRLEAVTTDACRKFHIDQMPARLLCTYRGPGTQFGLADGSGQVVPAGEMRTGEAAILRGALWPGKEVTRLLHRSPPIADSGGVRLLLVLDPAMEPADRARRLH
ncbi:DUF1826 domain-containing protein [Paracoccus siganidrum]|uniref:DUF1826 domain-containing protein n=1 Tax=Paracoccus siganidrum TaxID=1276757 RepID=A0A418ZVH3_9RHOB|nr:DUF1826 domain-containing protein [Paracoccus siganidrum]RJL03314.1 DUF1826 domain-containing protein [Paracoccus siganidrum]RMC30543.1 DUF1826 domain-containing protein [Paracoccus siganidrum]